jgi:hypothetical protein
MKVLALAIGAMLAVAPLVPAVANPTVLAPADDYFGHERMSVLGVRNAIRDLDLRASYHFTGDGPVLYHKLLIVEDSMNDWRRQYPNDTWIPRMGYALARAWLKLGYADAREHARFTLGWIVADYPASRIAPWAAALRNAGRVLTADDWSNPNPLPIPIENP